MAGVATRLPLGARQALAQKRTYLGLGAAILVPIAFVVALVAPERRGRPMSRSGAPSATPDSRPRSSSSSSFPSGVCR